MKSNDIQLFTAYLENDLSKTEIESFEIKLNEDPVFAKDFEEFKDIYRVIENRLSPERAALIENIQKADSDFILKDNSEEKIKKIIPFRPWQLGIAASILLVIG